MMTAIPLPIFLLGAIWAGFVPLVRLAEIVNERRDKILDAEGKMSHQHRRRILYSDWSIYIGMVIFHLIVFIAIFAMLPDLLDATGSTARTVCYIAAVLPFLFVVLTLVSAIKDFRMMVSFLEKYKAQQDEMKLAASEIASQDISKEKN